MRKEVWTNSDLHKLFKLNLTKPALLKAEERGDIPKAIRVPHGKVQVRQWGIEQLPEIGKNYGFLAKPKSQKVICLYTPKGGCLKTSLCFNLARILALNGLKTLVVGLDFQGSVTDLLVNQDKLNDLRDFNPHKGLYQWMGREESSLNEVILKTELPTLDLIPENPGLPLLEKLLRSETKREEVFTRRLIKPLQNNYDVILFDNGPSWNLLIENALAASNIVIAPIGCEIGSYQALETNLDTINQYQEEMKIEWDDFIMVPTLLEKTKLSQQIHAAYMTKYPDYITDANIRRSVSGQESHALQQSIFEHSPTSLLASDYFDLSTEVWNRILKKGD